jgi:predicted metal-dependent hydrolase
MSFIIFSQNEGQLTILTPTGELTLEEVLKKDLPLNTPYKIVDSLDIDNKFYNAYEFDKKLGAKINISKAKEIWKNKWRAVRKPLFEKLDIDFIKAVETMNTEEIQQIALKKQQLRDVTDTSLPDNLESIKKTWPSILNS